MKIKDIENNYRKNYNIDISDPFEIEMNIIIRKITDESKNIIADSSISKDAKYEIFIGGNELDGEHTIIYDTDQIGTLINKVIKNNFC